jgi:hypothetical protein
LARAGSVSGCILQYRSVSIVYTASASYTWQRRRPKPVALARQEPGKRQKAFQAHTVDAPHNSWRHLLARTWGGGSRIRGTHEHEAVNALL